MQGLVQDERKDPPNAGSGSSTPRVASRWKTGFWLTATRHFIRTWLGVQDASDLDLKTLKRLGFGRNTRAFNGANTAEIPIGQQQYPKSHWTAVA